MIFSAGKTAYNATYTTQSVRPAAAQQHKATGYAAGYTPAPQQPQQSTNYTYTAPVQTQQPAKVVVYLSLYNCYFYTLGRLIIKNNVYYRLRQVLTIMEAQLP